MRPLALSWSDAVLPLDGMVYHPFNQNLNVYFACTSRG